MAIARREGDPSLELRALSWASATDLHHTFYEVALEKSQRAITLCRGLDDANVEMELRFTATTILLTIGDTVGARQNAETLLKIGTWNKPSVGC